MSSIIFNPSMLTALPSPSPSPEERPQDGGDASTNDATLDDPAPKEPEESEADRVARAWAAVLISMRAYVKTHPPLQPTLLEEQELWLHDWNTVMNDMNTVFEWARAADAHVLLENSDAVDLDKGKAAVKLLTKAIKAIKQKAEESVLIACLVRVEKEKGPEASKAADKGKGKATETEKDAPPVVADAGRPRFGGRLTIPSTTTHPEVPCARCASTDSLCVLNDTSSQCNGCTKAKKACSFVSDKAKERTPAAAKVKAVAPKAKTPVLMPAPKAKTLVSAVAPTAGSVTDTAPVVGDSDVEIIGESTADENAVGGSRTIVVQRPKRPLAACPAPAPKRPRLNLEAQLEESRIEAAQLRIRNAKLEAEVAKWRGTVVDLRQHSRMQEAELLSMSNQIYSMGRDWGAWEKEIAKMLENK
ncbi:hypothetical protein EV424DRAFT_1341068 [Suillus variegatus]|nr:hypothetical protein EV424DRAFT_1341068 [Suillus variegatus]